MKYMRIIFIIFSFSSLCHSQALPVPDTVFFLFDQQSSDSLYTYVTTSGVEPTEATIKKYLKEVVSNEQGSIKQVQFRICEETFVYRPEKCSVDTLARWGNHTFTSVESANQQAARKIAAYIEDNKKSESLTILFNQDVLVTYVVEKTPD